MLIDWLKDHAAIFFAALSGATVQVATAWKEPKVAIRQFVVCMIMAAMYGPAFYKGVEYFSPISGDEIKFAVITSVGLGGVYVAEAVIFLWKKWSENPSLPFPFPWSKKP